MADNRAEFRDLDQQVARISDDIKKIAENLPQMKRIAFILLFCLIFPVLAYDIHQVQVLNSNLSEMIKLQNNQAESLTAQLKTQIGNLNNCLLYTSPSPRDATLSRMPSSA